MCKLTSQEALGLIEILQLVTSHPHRFDYMDEDLKAALEWITTQLKEKR